MKQIEVTIGPDGSVKIETSGYSDSSCEEATSELEKTLGITRVRLDKAERFESSHARVRQR